ncbi:hypothetical protein [Vibrio taketomensis]|nr:hypothetical protein [Vibrio taketomensis]
MEKSNNGEVVTQWLLTPRTKGQSKYFLALVDQEDMCIDAKYISRQTMLVCLERWNEPL